MKDERIFILRDESRRARAISKIAKLSIDSGLWEVVIRPFKKSRSLAQNRLMWWWYKHIQRHVFDTKGEWYSDEQIHEWFKDEYLPTNVIEIGGKVKSVRKSTAALKVDEMTEYLEHIDHHCVETLNLVLPHPADLYDYAMRGRKAA